MVHIRSHRSINIPDSQSVFSYQNCVEHHRTHLRVRTLIVKQDGHLTCAEGKWRQFLWCRQFWINVNKKVRQRKTPKFEIRQVIKVSYAKLYWCF